MNFFFFIWVSVSCKKNEEFVTVMPGVKLQFFVSGKKSQCTSFKLTSTHFSFENYCMKLADHMLALRENDPVYSKRGLHANLMQKGR